MVQKALDSKVLRLGQWDGITEDSLEALRGLENPGLLRAIAFYSSNFLNYQRLSFHIRLMGNFHPSDIPVEVSF